MEWKTTTTAMEHTQQPTQIINCKTIKMSWYYLCITKLHKCMDFDKFDWWYNWIRGTVMVGFGGGVSLLLMLPPLQNSPVDFKIFIYVQISNYQYVIPIIIIVIFLLPPLPHYNCFNCNILPRFHPIHPIYDWYCCSGQ